MAVSTVTARKTQASTAFYFCMSPILSEKDIRQIHEVWQEASTRALSRKKKRKKNLKKGLVDLLYAFSKTLCYSVVLNIHYQMQSDPTSPCQLYTLGSIRKPAPVGPKSLKSFSNPHLLSSQTKAAEDVSPHLFLFILMTKKTKTQ